MGINYGSNKMRFLQPVAVNSEVRGMATLKEVTEKPPGQLLLKNEFVVQIKGEDKPALVAEILSMFIVQ
jgi:acyl dehydratase